MLWSLLILLMLNLLGFAAGLGIGYWQLFGDTFEETIANNRIARRIAYFVMGVLLYWRFAAGLTRNRLPHVLALFALVNAIDALIGFFVFRAPLGGLFDLGGIARSGAAALIGLGLASLRLRRAFRRSTEG